MQKFTTKTIVSLSVLVALQIVLTRFCSFSAWNVRIGFGFVALVIAAVVHGPVAAALVGGLGDVLLEVGGQGGGPFYIGHRIADHREGDLTLLILVAEDAPVHGVAVVR